MAATTKAKRRTAAHLAADGFAALRENLGVRHSRNRHAEEYGFNVFKDVLARLDARYDHLVWVNLKNSEIARDWDAKELTRITLDNGSIHLQAPYACPEFTLDIPLAPNVAPQITAAGKPVTLCRTTNGSGRKTGRSCALICRGGRARLLPSRKSPVARGSAGASPFNATHQFNADRLVLGFSETEDWRSSWLEVSCRPRADVVSGRAVARPLLPHAV